MPDACNTDPTEGGITGGIIGGIITEAIIMAAGLTGSKYGDIGTIGDIGAIG